MAAERGTVRLNEAPSGVYICFTKSHAITVDTNAKKIYNPCFPTSEPLSAIRKHALVKCWQLSCASGDSSAKKGVKRVASSTNGGVAKRAAVGKTADVAGDQVEMDDVNVAMYKTVIDDYVHREETLEQHVCED